MGAALVLLLLFVSFIPLVPKHVCEELALYDHLSSGLQTPQLSLPSSLADILFRQIFLEHLVIISSVKCEG